MHLNEPQVRYMFINYRCIADMVIKHAMFQIKF